MGEGFREGDGEGRWGRIREEDRRIGEDGRERKEKRV